MINKLPINKYSSVIELKINEIIDFLNDANHEYASIEDVIKQAPISDPYAEQRKWIGCLVRYKICDFQGGWYTDVLDEIVDHPIYPFKMRNGQTAQVCEVVEPNEIYPNKARTW